MAIIERDKKISEGGYVGDFSLFNNSQRISEIERDPIKVAVDTAPTGTPAKFKDQFVIYENGATKRLYVWVAGTWSYMNLT